MENKKTIFEVLNEKNICYSVVVSLVKHKMKSIEGSKKEYFIIVHRKDLRKLVGFDFYTSDVYKHIIYERDLCSEEIDKFKEISDSFVKVQHDSNGRVYELKENSFKLMYDNLKQVWN